MYHFQEINFSREELSWEEVIKFFSGVVYEGYGTENSIETIFIISSIAWSTAQYTREQETLTESPKIANIHELWQEQNSDWINEVNCT